jgi:hypothetical protein
MVKNGHNTVSRLLIWTFVVEIDVITDTNKESVVPYAVESQGDAPQQYDDFY